MTGSRTVVVVVFALVLLGAVEQQATERRVQARPVNCSPVPSQAAADAHDGGELANHRNLDGDRYGLACETYRCPCEQAPMRLAAQPSPSPSPAATPSPSPDPSPEPSPTPVISGVEVVRLLPGCNNEVITWPAGTPVGAVAAAIAPPEALESIFRFDNATGTFVGFAPNVPEFAINYPTVVARLEVVFICMRAPGALERPVA